MHRLKPSLSATKKSPMSAWQRSISSTRRTPDRLKAWCRKLVAAVVAAVAAVAEVVAVAAEAAAVAEAAAAAAARRGEHADFAEPRLFLTTLTSTNRHGRVRQGRPGQFYVVLPACARVDARMTTELISNLF
jgi:hypothetical protein